MSKAKLILEDGSIYEALSFGSERSVSGELVFYTAMIGYPESLTDPSYKGQILVPTFPMIGNYGVPDDEMENGISRNFESEKIHCTALVISDYSEKFSHWNSDRNLGTWLKQQDVPGLYGIDTRALTKKLRERGAMLGKIVFGEEDIPFHDPNRENLVAQVSTKEVRYYGNGKYKVLLVDCGVKNNIMRCRLKHDVTIKRVPWDYDFNTLDFDALFLSNGPGNPETCAVTVNNIRKFISNPDEKRPLMGICLGHQLLGKAAGADIYKLKYGHRSHNQPARMEGDVRCFVTSQNHGYAVDADTLPADWAPWFTNMNDGSNEGIRHTSRPWRSVQFHPEACGGPVDTEFLFDEFIDQVKSL